MKEEKLTELTVRLFEECKDIYNNIQYRNCNTEQLNQAIQNICQITSELAYWAHFGYGEKAALQAIKLAEELLKAHIANEQARQIGEIPRKQATGGGQE